MREAGLRHDAPRFGLFGQSRQEVQFGQVVGERGLEIQRPARLEDPGGLQQVPVIGGRDHHAVNSGLGQHVAQVDGPPDAGGSHPGGGRHPRDRLVENRRIDIDQGVDHHVGVGGQLQREAQPLLANSHHSQLQPAVDTAVRRSFTLGPGDDTGSHPRSDTGGIAGTAAQKLPAVESGMGNGHA